MPKQRRISNVFELIDDDIPIAPWPWFVTITLDTASGKDVPAARNVKPITESGTLAVSPGVKQEQKIQNNHNKFIII